ncbi:MAG: Txe/YoeB family addiction module toxin [Synergistaceae bacterium]|nr:Txe/YoeB family addiction module toxin [Synergistaceae bacterium]
MDKLIFAARAWNDYLYWQTQDRKTLRRINALINDIKRNRYEGIGKPEALSGDLSGFWSRRIDEQNRIIYRIVDEVIELVALRTHYE